MLPFHGIEIITNPYLGELVTPAYPRPERLKKYKQRTLKRWRKRHPAYYQAKGEYFVFHDSGAIMCHPDDKAKLEAAMRQARTAFTDALN